MNTTPTPQTLAQRRLEILHWERDNRNLLNRNIGNDCCMYEPQGGEKKYGCGVGRLLPEDIQKKCDTFVGDGPDGSSVSRKELFDLLPEDVKDLEHDFLVHLQLLHDTGAFWTNEGPSDEGIKRIEFLEKTFCKDAE